MQSTPLQDGRMCDTMGTRNLVLRVAPNGVPTVRGPLLRGIRCQAVREMLLPCPPRGYSAADATAQCPKAKRPVGVGVGCLSRGGSWVSPWQELLLLSCWNVSSPPPGYSPSCSLPSKFPHPSKRWLPHSHPQQNRLIPGQEGKSPPQLPHGSI